MVLVESFNGLIYRMVAKIIGRQNTQHIHADIGWAGPHGKLVLMGDLVVIRRKPGSILANKIGKISPGPASDFPE